MARESRINVCAFKTAITTVSILHIITELVNAPTETSLNALILILLVNGLYKIITESIKRVLISKIWAPVAI